MRRAARADAPEAATLRLRAAMLWEARDDLEAVAGALAALDASRLGRDDRWRLDMLKARLALASGDPRGALAYLERIPDLRFGSPFEGDAQTRLRTLRAEVFEAVERPLQAARERIYLEGLLAAEARAENRARIWETLVQLGPDELEAARSVASGEPVLRGWLELATIARAMHPTLEAQQRDVELWRRRWDDHPAALALPERLARLPRLIATRPRHVALLLPLSGDLASAGRAIRDGFVSAQYEAARSGGFTPRLSFIDSAATGARAGYLQAVDAGAELVVGPLEKSGVDALGDLPVLEVPVLALNSTTDGRRAPSLIQFALLPEVEGRQLADRMFEDGVRRTLLLVQAASWADRIEAAFAERFTALGGEVVQRQAFASTGEIGEAVQAALLVSESEARARLLRRLLTTQIEFEPRRRQDIDAIVAISDPVHGGTLKPALDYYFAGDLPVYASSQIHDPARTTTGGDDPLAGIRFCDMPWRLLDLPERRRVETAWPEAGPGTTIFHAIGVDAWRLHGRLGESTSGWGARLTGVTGDLVVDADGSVERALSWAVMTPSGPMALPRVVSDG